MLKPGSKNDKKRIPLNRERVLQSAIAIADTAGVALTSSLRSGQALMDAEEGTVTGIDPATIGHFYKFDWTEGSARTPAGRSSP